jgi:hypothetical protein
MAQSHKHRFAMAACLLTLLFASGGIRFAEAGSATVPSEIVAVSPYRILDTRTGVGTGGAVAPVGPGATITLAVRGVGPVPANAVGVVLNITGTSATAPTYVTAWPSGEIQETTSTLNVLPGQTAPNMITAALGADGGLHLFNAFGSVDLVADVAGYLLPAGAVAPNLSVSTGYTTLSWGPGTTTSWFTYSGGTSNGWVARVATIAVPQLTQAIIDRGTVELWFKPDTGANAWAPLPFSQASGDGWSRVIEYRYSVGQIQVYWMHQKTDTAVIPPTVASATPLPLQVRWSIRPG